MKFAQLSILLMALVIALVSVVEAKTKATQVVKFSKKVTGKSTWFNGNQLNGAACYGDLENNSHMNAKDSMHIAAVHMASYKGGEKAACFECVQITNGRRSVVVRIIDDCAGCAPNQIDLTRSAFKALAPLSQGVVHTTYKFVRCPSSGSKLKWPKSPAVKKS